MARRSPSRKRGKSYRSRNLNFNRNRGSGRAFAVAAIFFMLALFLAPPIKSYFVQRAQINALESQLSSDRAALEAALISKWGGALITKAPALKGGAK